MSTYAAVVLAAGRATRFRAAGGQEPTKLLATLRGMPLVRHAAGAALRSRAHPVILVTGHASEAVAEAVADLELTILHNAGYADGLASSLRVGIGAVPSLCDGAVVVLADMPGVRASLIDALIERAASRPETDAVVPVFAGQRGHPALLARNLFPKLAGLSGDVGARRLLFDPSVEVEEVPQSDHRIMEDIDVPEQLRRLENGENEAPFTVR